MGTPTTNKPLDLVETAHKMMNAAAAVTTGRLHLSSPEDALALLAHGDEQAISNFRLELARQIASALLMMDPHVVAVFEDRDTLVSTALDEPLRLWVQVRHRTAALNTVIDALNQALGQAFAVISPDPPRDLVETIIIDERDSRILNVRVSRLSPAPVLLVQRV
jgi:hypothetical protein